MVHAPLSTFLLLKQEEKTKTWIKNKPFLSIKKKIIKFVNPYSTYSLFLDNITLFTKPHFVVAFLSIHLTITLTFYFSKQSNFVNYFV